MFEEIIDFHQRKFRNIFKSNQLTHIDEINGSSEIPHWVKAYFDAQLNFEIYKLRRDVETNLLFDFAVDEIRESWRAFEYTLKTKSQIDTQTIENWINDATKLYINYLIRPRFTIVTYIFKDDIENSIENIRRNLQFFDNYQYLINEIANYIDKFEESGRYSISRREFNQAINQIDDEFFKNTSIQEVSEIFEPFFDIFNIRNYDYQFLPIAALMIFLNDKKWGAAERALTEVQKKTNATLWTKPQVLGFLENYKNIDFDNAVSEQIPLFKEND